MGKETKIKELERRIKELENRPVYIPYPVQTIPAPPYPPYPNVWYGTGSTTGEV